MFEPITHATLTWQPNGEPYSERFRDVYFRQDKGIEETAYVFLGGNHLPERWKDKKHFTIAETGFGTGLNFLATWKLWQETAEANAILHYISFEQFPIRPMDLRKIYRLWPEYATQSEALLAAYPPPISGFHRIFLHNIALTLVWGDAGLMLPDTIANVDAWFLDGFAPRQNPEMWTPELNTQIARLTAPGGTFATFTATGYVRRGMEAAGFNVEKRPGFEGKREMLVGRYGGFLSLRLRQEADGGGPSPFLRGEGQDGGDKKIASYHEISHPHPNPPPSRGREFPSHLHTPANAPWFTLPAPPPYINKQAIIIGGGLAGTASAYSLARRGWKITLIERHAELAQEASGNPGGILMPLITAPEDIVGQFYLEAYRYAVQHVKALGAATPGLWNACGVLQLHHENPKNASGHPALSAGMMLKLSAAEASQCAGVKLSREGWFFPQGGWASPPLLCKAQVEAYKQHINILYHQEAIRLEYNDGWKVTDIEGKCLAEAPVLILANALDATKLLPTEALPLRRVRGQVTYLPASTASQKLQTVLCYEGYVLPAVQGIHSLGATFQPDEENTAPTTADHAENLAMLAPYIPQGFIGTPDINILDGRVAFRAASPDRRPLVGPMPDSAQCRKDYSDLTHGRHYKLYPPGSYVPGLYMSLGHGSRGLVSTGLAGELLACQITGEALPLEKPLVDALNPMRFVIRALKSGK